MLLAAPTIAFADQAGSNVTPEQLAQNRAMLVSALLYLLYAVSFIGGLWVLKTSVGHFLSYKENQVRGQHSGKKIVIGFIIAGALLSPTKSINLTLSTIGINDGSENGYCFAYDTTFLKDHQAARNADIQDKSSGVIDAKSLIGGSATPSCLTTPLTKLQDALKQSGEKKGLWDKLGESSEFQFLIGLIQVIAVYFYFTAWFKVWSISEGKGAQGESYGPHVVTIFFSSLVYNLPSTLDMIIKSAGQLFG